MIFDYVGSNGENNFSSQTPLSLYRFHPKSRFGGSSPQQIRF